MNYYLYQNPEDPRKAELKEQITNKLENIVTDPAKADLILVLWGDGTLLYAIRELYQHKKPFFGVNCGTLWFMLNDITDVAQIPTSFDEMELITEPFLEADIRYIPEWKTESIIKESILAVNDILLCENNLMDMPTFVVKEWSNVVTQFRGSAVLISSALGSTGTRASLHGPMLPTGNNNIWCMGIAAAPYFYDTFDWDISHEISIYKQMTTAHIDGKEKMVLPNVDKIIVRISKEDFTLWFLAPRRNSSVFHNKRLKLFSEKVPRLFRPSL
jgi:NAD kinase